MRQQGVNNTEKIANMVSFISKKINLNHIRD